MRVVGCMRCSVLNFVRERGRHEMLEAELRVLRGGQEVESRC